MMILLNESTHVSECCWAHISATVSCQLGTRLLLHIRSRIEELPIGGAGAHVDEGLLPHGRFDGLMSVRDSETKSDDRSNEDADVEDGSIAEAARPVVVEDGHGGISIADGTLDVIEDQTSWVQTMLEEGFRRR